MNEQIVKVNRVTVSLRQFWCPCCDMHRDFTDTPDADRPQMIINNGVLATLTCPDCNRIVQVWVQGESYTNIHEPGGAGGVGTGGGNG